jgi:hypothetical protein
MILNPNSEPWLGLTNDIGPKAFNQYAIEAYNTAQKLREKVVSNELRRLEANDCIEVYATEFQTTRGSVILVTKEDSEGAGDNSTTPLRPTFGTESVSESIFGPANSGEVGCKPHPFEWICGGSSDECPEREPCVRIWQTKVDASNWTPRGSHVDYCLSEDAEPLCRLQFDKRLAYVVISFNAIKMLVLAYIFFGMWESPLLTMGDAVVSFMKRADLTTAGWCLMSRDNRLVKEWSQSYGPKGRSYDARPKRWSKSVSGHRWFLTMLILCLATLLCLVLLFVGILHRPTSRNEMMTLPFGAIDPRALIMSWAGWELGGGGESGTVLWNAFMANVPQVFLSFLYFAYNGLFTCFLLGKEWTSYSVERKGLRVSHGPRGSQRSTYFLQLPYRVAVPMLALCGALHWVCSQSIFLVSVLVDTSVRDGQGQPPTEFALCGYSPPAILTLVVVGLIMVGFAWAMGRRKFHTGMPIAGSCSLAMSAFCHLHEWEDGVASAEMPVQWGAIAGEMADLQWMHCSFSARAVQEPLQGVVYGGLPRRPTHEHDIKNGGI